MIRNRGIRCRSHISENWKQVPTKKNNTFQIQDGSACEMDEDEDLSMERGTHAEVNVLQTLNGKILY